MANKIQFKRGAKANLPTLSVGEPGFCTDTKELYIGAPDGEKIKINKKLPYIDVKEDFGVKGDGVTDDTEAIQSAINSTEAGGTIYIPAGDFICDTLLLTNNFVSIVGAGNSSRIKFKGSGNWLEIRNCLYCKISNLSIETVDAPSDGSIISVDAASWIFIDKVTMGFYSKIYNGISITNTEGGSQAIYIQNSTIAKHQGAGIKIDTSNNGIHAINDVFISDCWVQWLPHDSELEIAPSTAIGLYINQNAALQAININNTEFSNGYWGVYAVGSKFIHIDQTYFDANNYIEYMSMATFINCWFSGNNTPNPETNAFVLKNATAVQFIGCHYDPAAVLNSSSADIIVQGTSDHVLFNSCMIGGAGYYGIMLQSGDNIIIKGCYIGNNATFANPCNIVTAIQLLSDLTGTVTICDNDLTETNTKIFNDSGAKNKVFIFNNRGYNPLGGNASTPAIGASGITHTNNTGVRVRIYISGGSSVSVDINSYPTFLSSGEFTIDPGETIKVSYSSVPTWVWFGL